MTDPYRFPLARLTNRMRCSNGDISFQGISARFRVTHLPGQSVTHVSGPHPYRPFTHRPNEKSFDVVSVTACYPFKKDAPAEIDIGGNKFDLYTAGDGAWARNDKAVVQVMLKGKAFVIHGVPAKGDPTADTYSLDGFAKAYGYIGKACGVK